MHEQEIIDRLNIEEFWASKVVTERGCWEWTGAKSNGYGAISRRINGVLITAKVTRIAWLLTYGSLDNFILHHCDNPPCFNPDMEYHLFSGSHQDNMADMVAKGRAVSGTALHPECIARGDRSGRRLHPERYDNARLNFRRFLDQGGIPARGERISNLKENQVTEIRSLFSAGGLTYADLGRRFNTDRAIVRAIILRRTWKHVA